MPITVFRDLPGVADFEKRFAMRDRLMLDELKQLMSDGDKLSLELFGITLEQTIDPPAVPDGYIEDAWSAKRSEWNRHFAWLEQDETEAEAAFWDAIGIDMTDTDGDYLACLYEFGRQIVCVVKSLHPDASFRFRSDLPKTDAQIMADAELWGRKLLH